MVFLRLDIKIQELKNSFTHVIKREVLCFIYLPLYIITVVTFAFVVLSLIVIALRGAKKEKKERSS